MLDLLLSPGWLVPSTVAATVTVMMLCGWFVSRIHGDASVADALWGASLAMAALLSYAVTDGLGDERRRVALVALVCVWGVRLATHLSVRRAQWGEDPRYAAMRLTWGDARWGLVSLYLVFGLQSVLAFTVALPVIAVLGDRAAAPLGLFDALGFAVAALGLGLEATADRQLERFRAHRATRPDAVLSTGLWRYSRHPNYFGEWLFWLGTALMAVSVAAPWALVSPALVVFLLLRVSGLPPMERGICDRRPGYAAYRARTSAFFPWPPKPEAPTDVTDTAR